MKKKRLKIAIIADALDYQYAGIYYYTKEILQALARIDTHNQYLFVRSLQEGNIADNVREIIIPTGKFPGAAPYRLFVSIPQRLKKEKVDIVVEPRHFGPFNLPKNIKRITFIHDLTPIHHPEWHQFFSRTLQKIFLPSILKSADHILTNSEFTKQDILQYFPNISSKITATHLGKESFFRPNPNFKSLESLGILFPYFLHVGTIEPRKNLSTLLKAFEAYKREANNNTQLILVGKKGWKNEQFFEALKQSPFNESVRLIGYVKREELVTLYSSAIAFIFPSLFEGFGLPILEAMSCGCPVICSNTGSLPEIGESACLYFDPTSSEEIAHHLKSIANNTSLRKEMAAASLKQASKFSWDETAKKSLEVFQSLSSK